MSDPTQLHNLINYHKLQIDCLPDGKNPGTKKIYCGTQAVHLTFSKKEGWGIEKEPETTWEHAKKIFDFALRCFLTFADTMSFGVIPYLFQLESPTLTPIETILNNRNSFVDPKQIDSETQKQLNDYIHYRFHHDFFGVAAFMSREQFPKLFNETTHARPPTLSQTPLPTPRDLPTKESYLDMVKAQVKHEIAQIKHDKLTIESLFFLLQIHVSADKDVELKTKIEAAFTQNKELIKALLKSTDSFTYQQQMLKEIYCLDNFFGKYFSDTHKTAPTQRQENNPAQTTTQAPLVQGIKNGGNYCWMISSLQVLFASEHFRNLVRDSQQTNDVATALKNFLKIYEAQEPLHDAMVAITTELYFSGYIFDFNIDRYTELHEQLEKLEKDTTQTSLQKEFQRRTLEQNLRQVEMHSQFDASYAFEGIFQALKHTPCKMVPVMYTRDKTTQLSQGENKPEDISMLPADLDPKKTMKENIESYFDEWMDDYRHKEQGGDTYGARKITNFERHHPQLLPIKFPRFRYHQGLGGDKNNNELTMEKEFTLETPDGKKSTYRLVGYNRHHGGSITGGHYSAVTLRGEQLYCQNDGYAGTEDDILLKNADPYLALYERTGDA